MGLVVLGLTLLGQAAWASPCDACGAETLAQGCDGITFEGCCLPNGDVVSCEEGYVCLIRCSNNQPLYKTCGWNAHAEFYDCGQTGADPSGQHPKDCSACQPDCTGKKCGNGGCVLMPDACGKCTECGKTCVSGFCVFTACESKAEELLVEVRFSAKGPAYRSVFHRLGTRKALAIAKVSVAVGGEVGENGVLKGVRVALGAVGPTVLRAVETERLLEGVPALDCLEAACDCVKKEARPISDIRSTEEYRREMCGVLLRRAVMALIEK